MDEKRKSLSRYRLDKAKNAWNQRRYWLNQKIIAALTKQKKSLSMTISVMESHLQGAVYNGSRNH